MATSSMHKPGWRSRRRSRLSLVERAVPRLGRLTGPEEGAGSTRSEELRSPVASKSVPQQTRSPTTEVKARLKGKTAMSTPMDGAELVHPRGDDREDRQEGPVVPVPEPAEGDDRTSEQGEDVGAGAETRSGASQAEGPGRGGTIEPNRQPPGDPSPDGVEAAPAIENAHAVSEEAVPSDGVASRSSIESPDEADALQETGPDASAGLLPPQAASPDMAADAEGATAGPSIALDWDRLVEIGYTDPRDRGRPLPRQMDDIIRALIRQALSDQSSWRDRVILVTSPNERASKSAAAINFAFGLTTVANHHAVLVDVDTVGPGAVDRLGGGSFTGITATLADDSIGMDELVIRTDLDRLTLVASGPPDDDQLDRFASRRMLQILRHLTRDPDTLLVIDAPPILASQEAAVLSVVAGQVVLAVEAGKTTADQIEHALQRIGERHNVSLVLNDNCGIAHEDSAPIITDDEIEARRRTPTRKRRSTKAAAAAGAVLLGLVMAGGDAARSDTADPKGDARIDGAATKPATTVSRRAAPPPERWSLDSLPPVESLRQNGR